MPGNLIVAVRGTGVAASCCQALLGSAGIAVHRLTTDRPRVPAIMLSPATQTLLADVFQKPDLFQGLWQINRRVVAWGRQPQVDLAHSAIVVSEQDLLERLHQPLKEPTGDPTFTIHTSRALEASAAHDFGSRTATATQIQLTPEADPRACLMESREEGWLFLLPVSARTAWLLTAGASREELLKSSRLIPPAIAAILTESASFPSHPRITDPLAGPDWLACGSAALRFDPLCGDGTGHAVREAILACAVIRGQADPDALNWEYRLRLWAGFHRHLELCRQFYSTGGDGPWWRTEFESLITGLQWLAQQTPPHQLGRFRLNGFLLE